MARLTEWLGLNDYLSGVKCMGAGVVILGGVAAAGIYQGDLYTGLGMEAGRGVVVYARSVGMLAAEAELDRAESAEGRAAGLATSRTTSRAGAFAAGDQAGIRNVAAELDRERRCLAIAIYFEARGESYYGRKAVAEVIVNRVADERYPESICDVVYQGAGNGRKSCQFTFACDGKSDRPRDKIAWTKAMRLATYVTLGVKRPFIAGDATHYHADYVNPVWSTAMEKTVKLGRHVFYRDRETAKPAL